MKSIMVSDNLHRWIMDHKDAEKNSAEKVIYYLIGRVDELDIPATDEHVEIPIIADGNITEWNAIYQRCKELDIPFICILKKGNSYAIEYDMYSSVRNLNDVGLMKIDECFDRMDKFDKEYFTGYTALRGNAGSSLFAPKRVAMVEARNVYAILNNPDYCESIIPSE